MKSPILPPKPDDLPEHIHMVVCGAGFFALYFLFRSVSVGHLIAALLVLLISIPAMYFLVPITIVIYRCISEFKTRRSNIHVTDAGFSALVIFVFAMLMFPLFKAHRPATVETGVLKGQQENNIENNLRSNGPMPK